MNIEIKCDKMLSPIFQHIQDTFSMAEIVRFFLIFSWFEYSLKRAVPIKRNVDNIWNGFASSIDNGEFQTRIANCPELEGAVKFLLDAPPKKQNGSSSVKAPVGASEEAASILIDYVRIVRNNMFHGGKIPFDQKRDIPLIKNSIIILEHFLELKAASEVKSCYFTGGSIGNKTI